ncbi:acyl-coenzyme A thioesterase THEM4-like isoform X2 [Acanthaster planci]|nr:acyl-coenzyme A thioesterase THEM4-like isoform X2 [Acanthaster planci]XP_022103656.1 acyl-coenzyme A thioesterase THEM4-like isoform X2 [Acanthaster planci]
MASHVHASVGRVPLITRLLQATVRPTCRFIKTGVSMSSLASRGRRSHTTNHNHSGICYTQFPQVRNVWNIPQVPSSSQNTWLPETEALYSQLRAQAEKSGWEQVRNTSTDSKPFPQFPRVMTKNGPVIHYAIFVSKEEKKLIGVCQFGVEAQGPKGLVHGGASATMHDVITAHLSLKAVSEKVLTASLTVDFKRPTLMRSAMLMEANIDKIEGSKIFLRSYLKSPDGATVYSSCSALYVNIGEKSQKS